MDNGYMKDRCHPRSVFPAGWGYGGYAKRRREDAILQQCALRSSFLASRVPRLGRSHDMRNAFATPHQERRCR